MVIIKSAGRYGRRSLPMKVNVINILPEHLAAVWTIEQRAHRYPWRQSMIEELSGRGACHYCLVDEHGQVLGYCYGQNIVGEVSLLNVAVDPEYHGQGLGKQLMESFISECEKANAESIWLEVRESNQAAIALYHSVGFNEVDRRRDYYPTSNGREDALIMSYLFLAL